MAHIYNDHEQPVTIMVDINDTSNSTGFSEDSKCGSVSRVPKAQDLFRGMCKTGISGDSSFGVGWES